MTSAGITVVHIFSTSYAGSTWLNLLLGSHSQCFSVGEMKSVLKLGHAVCTMHGRTCPVWSRFEHPSDENPYLQLNRITGKQVFVVNNSRRFAPYEKHQQIRTKYIHLIRDGRAVVASFLRKRSDLTLVQACRTWKRKTRHNLRRLRRQRSADLLEVKYEMLHADTQGQLARLCQFVGVPFEPTMLEYWNHAHHFLGGNQGTLFSLAKKRGQQLPPDPKDDQPRRTHWDLDYYGKADLAHFSDERWMKELTPRQLRMFGLIAGFLNRRLGYAPKPK